MAVHDGAAGQTGTTLSEETGRAVARAVLPEMARESLSVYSGGEHLVVVAPKAGVVRVSRTPETAALMPRRTGLLAALSQLGLPFAVPEPLSEVVTVDGYTAVATTWVPGEPHPKGAGDPVVLRALMATLRDVEVAPLAGLLAEPHGYAGGGRWAELMADAVACLPADVRDDAQRRIDEALALPPVPPSLVHGDLGGHNVRWSADGRLLGVIDWDWAAAWDPSVDAACLGWHGWEAVKEAVGAPTYQRARI